MKGGRYLLEQVYYLLRKLRIPMRLELDFIEFGVEAKVVHQERIFVPVIRDCGDVKKTGRHAKQSRTNQHALSRFPNVR
jgi:hypothetical protein